MITETASPAEPEREIPLPVLLEEETPEPITASRWFTLAILLMIPIAPPTPTEPTP